VYTRRMDNSSAFPRIMKISNNAPSTARSMRRWRYPVIAAGDDGVSLTVGK
jgi:hypothetical protein